MKVVIFFNVHKSLWNYVIALKWGLEKLHFDVESYEIDLSKPFTYDLKDSIILWCVIVAKPLQLDNKTILTHIFTKLRKSSNKLILYETERLDCKRIKWLLYFNTFVDEVWTYCLYNVNIAQDLGLEIYHIPHGYCKLLNAKNDHNNIDDVYFLAHLLTKYRRKIVNKFDIHTIRINPNTYSLHKNQINIHQHSEKNQPFESMRIGFLLSNSCNVFVDNLCKDDLTFWKPYIHYCDNFEDIDKLTSSHIVNFSHFQQLLSQDKLILESPLLNSLYELYHLQQLIVF